jgi:hypothetical protein
MEQKTREHFELALRNQRFALWLISDDLDSPEQSAEWVSIAAFYGAVHAINACLWELHRFEPVSHNQRNRRIERDDVLRDVRQEYRILRDRAYYARYVPTFRLSVEDARESCEVLQLIIDSVNVALAPEE